MKRNLTKNTVLAALLDAGEGYLRGAALAAELGISRTAVWKAICELKKDGYIIEGATNNGYRLINVPNLSQTGISQSLEKAVSEVFSEKNQSALKIKFFKEIDSTNSEARRIAQENAPETLIIAASQTAGRGRLGRSFFSPSASGLYMSFLLYPDCPASDATLITTAAAVATARAIESLVSTGEEFVGIKWVNDLYMRGKKICGILTEGQIDFETGNFKYAILGIGVNICPPKDGFPPEIADRAGAIFTEPSDDPDSDMSFRNELAVRIAKEFYQIYPRLDKTDYIDDYRRRMFLVGREVEVAAAAIGEIKPEDKKKAVVTALDEDFRLVVRYDDGSLEAIGAGEVTLKL